MQMLHFLPIFATFLVSIACAVGQQLPLDEHLPLDEDCPPFVTVTPVGRTLTELNETITQALNACQVRYLLQDTRHRLLFSRFSSDLDFYAGSTNVYEAGVYDYTHGRMVIVNGIPYDPTYILPSEANIQPLPNSDEIAEAGRIAGAGPEEIVTGGMPPVLTRDFPDGSSQRLLNIAVTSGTTSRSVVVNMNNETVEESVSASTEGNLACTAPPPASGSSTISGVGSINLYITWRGQTIWTFQATRPSASSGTKGSGVELRNVRYRGKLVLSQAHVPILNIQYNQPSGGCGPFYRDWQSQEWPFICRGTDFAPGFRFCSSPAESILDSNVDGGNFNGVAIYVEGFEVVLKSQMIAGWYRYISEWRFGVNGVLRPRFGFGAVYQYPFCVCQVHHHHVYWRLNFDIDRPENNLVREYNNPPIFPNTNYHDKVYEIRRPKDPSRHRHWEISNLRTNDKYGLFPGPNDGTMDSYGIGDLWVLKYHPTEIDDGVTAVGGNAATTMEHIDKFINGEVVRDADVVLWYAAHFTHDQSDGTPRIDHVVGPDLVPLNW